MRSPPLALGVMGRPIRQQATDGLALAQLRPTIPEHEIHRHTHDDMHFVLLLAGRYVSDARGMPAICDEPALLLNPPGTDHRDRFKTLDGLFLTLTMPAQTWARLTIDVDAPSHALRLDRRALARGLRWLPELWAWDDASPLGVETIVSEVIADRRVERAPNAVLDRVIERLDAPVVPSIRELAELVDLHPVYLARMFRRRFGQSPSDWIRQRRLHRAVSAIARGQSLAEAAATLGFVDQSHLHRGFVAEFGMTPGAFRRLALARHEVARIQDRLLRRC